MSVVADARVTPARRQRLREELHALLARRRLVLLEHAARPWSTDDEAESRSRAHPELGRLDRRIAELRLILDRATPCDAGARVTIRSTDGTEETYTIVGPDEVDLLRGWLLARSAGGHRLPGRFTGARSDCAIPGGQTALRTTNARQRRVPGR